MANKRKLKANHTHTAMDSVAHMLMNSMECEGYPDLQVEVVCSAMEYLKKNPFESVETACNYSMHEWIK